MQIIVVSSRLPKAISFNLSVRQLVMGAVLMVVALLMLSGSLSYVTLRHAAEWNIAFLNRIVAGAQEDESRRTEHLVRDNFKAIAAKVGQLQAQLLHLDTLGERLSSVAGIKPDEISAASPASAPPKAPLRQVAGSAGAGKGGPLVAGDQYRMSAEELGHEVDRLIKRADMHSDYLGVVESALMEARFARNRLPTVLPVNAAWSGSVYGWRTDPFTQQRALHEGVDFAADVGTPIVAAAGGIVITAEYHPEYGNLIEIDHGNGYSTRYAHASKLHVLLGQLIKRGQRIADVGSTGRSTGPHLHFEVRVNGASINPSRFLARADKPDSLPAPH
jgi:murein DD-endopeptidase MepM/ murein hydrolase activator NlpD